jgi:hypothetical protein
VVDCRPDDVPPGPRAAVPVGDDDPGSEAGSRRGVGHAELVRSKTPELTDQALRCLRMAHFAIRGPMHEAVRNADEDPGRLYFLHAVRVVQRRLPRDAAIPPSAEESPA